MICFILALALTFPANTIMSCKDFLALPETERPLFVRGLLDGLASSLGIHKEFAEQLVTRASSEEEKEGIRKMYLLPLWRPGLLPCRKRHSGRDCQGLCS